MTHTLKTGDAAYLDSFNGFIPVRVQSITGVSGLASTAQTVTYTWRGTKQDGKYEQFETSGLHVVPVRAIHFRKYGTRIAPYLVEVDE